MHYQSLLLAVLVAAVGCMPAATVPPAAEQAPPVAGQAALAAGQLRFAGQPAPHEFASLAAAGTEVVINLREPGEMDFDEAAIATAAGLDYYAVPVTRNGPGFSAAAMAEISAIVARHGDDEVLVHCASGNRVAAWYAIHLVETEGLDLETALARARARGLTRPALETRVREYFDARPGS